MQPILFAYDGSAEAQAAIKRSGELLDGGPAVVLTAWEPVAALTPATPTGTIDGGSFQGPTAEMNSLAEESATRIAAEGAAAAQAAGFEAEAVTEESRAWSAVVRTAEERDARLIVVGSHGHGGFTSALLGSVSNGVVHHSKRAVLVIPSTKR